MDFEKKQFLDYEGLALYDELIKKYIDKADEDLRDDLDAIIGESGEDLTTLAQQVATLIERVGQPSSEESDATGLYGELEDRDTKINELAEIVGHDAYTDAEGDGEEVPASGLVAQVKANTEALEVLNGEGEGSVAKAVEDAISGVVDGAPEAFDTLKEIAEWIATDESGATDLVNRIADIEDILGKPAVEAVEEVYHEASEEEVAAGLAENVGDKIVDVEGVEAQEATGLVADVAEAQSDIADNAEAIADNAEAIENLAEAIEALELENESLKAYIDAQDINVYNSIQSIEDLKIMALFPEVQSEEESAADAIANLDEGKALKLAANQEIAENIVIDKDCYIDANGSTFEGTVTVPADAEVIIVNATFANPVVVA